jgi:flagellar biosynthetic protein FliR
LIAVFEELNLQDWAHFLSALVLAMVRVSGMVAFAPFFSSNALPSRTKAVFVLAVSYLLAPLVAALPNAKAEIRYESLIGEVGVGILYGLTLALLNEMMTFAGQITGAQLSFSLVNLLDPTSSIQTPLLSDLFELLGMLVLITAGLDRILLASMVRSFHAVPLGGFALSQAGAMGVVKAASGVFLAAMELAAPVMAATLLVEVTVALLGKLSPQLPVMLLTVPIKTLAGFVVLCGSLAVWPRFIEARFAGLLDLAQGLIASAGKG